MKKACLLLLLLLPLALADSRIQTATIEVELEGSFTATERVHAVTLDVNLIPLTTDTQSPTMREIRPGGEKQLDKLVYTWSLPEGKHEYGYTARVNVNRPPVMITEKIKFPLAVTDIPDNTRQYLQPTKYIDSDHPSIQGLEAITGGEDNLWKAVSKIGIWVNNNIGYDLSTIAADTSQKASWTLQQKTGVCDEITNLFIALNRAQGVPARFVEGLAYTDKTWEPHGWAEVFFPGHGWVPFDITFGQYGWIDPYHISMQKSHEAEAASVDMEWRGSGTATLGEITFGAQTLSTSMTGHKQVLLEPALYKDNAGFGSYNLFAVKVKNPNPFWVTAQLELSQVDEIFPEQGRKRTAILAPKEEHYVFWTFKIQPNLHKDKRYTIPLKATTSLNDTAKKELVSEDSAQKYSMYDTSRQKSLLLDQLRKGASTAKILNCEGPRMMYTGQTEQITCTITPDTPQRNVNICVDRECKTVDVQEEAKVQLPIKWNFAGMEEFQITAKNNKMTQLDTILVQVLDEPKASFTVIAPNNVSYGDVFEIIIQASKESYSSPRNVEVKVTHDSWEREWEWEELNQETVRISFDSKELEPRPFNLEAKWNDEINRTYTKEKNWTTTYGELKWWQKIGRFFGGFFKSLKKAFF